MRDRAALSRMPHQASLPTDGGDPRVHATLAHLLALEGPARTLRFLPRQPAGSVLNGRHGSRLRGRGLNFEELRGYLPGDDVRSIDWKVTARTGTPHVRVMTEERDRPALLVVDQRMSMFFGTRHAMKSVTAAEAASLAAFGILEQGDRLGGMIFGDDTLTEIRPQRSRAAVHRVLAALAQANGRLHAKAPAAQPMVLSQVLSAVWRLARKDHLIIVLSDFDGIDDQAEALVAAIARHNDLILVAVSDPMALEIPKQAQLVVSDGRLQAKIDTTDHQTRQALTALQPERLAEVLDWQRRFGVPVLPLSSGAQTLPQIRRLMGLVPQ